jgi:hypothetical protein
MSQDSLTLADFQIANSFVYDWYFNTYPWLNPLTPADSSFPGFPPTLSWLLAFYQQDMGKRLLPTDSNFENNYEALLDYFLSNWTIQNDTNRLQGNTPLGYIAESIPEGISKTFTQVKQAAKDTVSTIESTIGSIGLYLLIAGIIIAIAYFYINKKKG